jgi:hypothetical protein
VRGAVDDEIVWQLETQLAIRGLPILMHEQSTAHHCPIQVEWSRTEDSPDTPLPLLTTFLCSTAGPASTDTGGGVDARPRTIRHALRLRLISLRQRDGAFGFFDHLEQTADFDDTLVVDIAPAGEQTAPRAWATWNSQIPSSIRDWRPTDDPLDDLEPAPGVWRGHVRMPPSTRSILGAEAAISITVTARG